MIYYHDVKQGTSKWLKLRENKVTASIAHILLKKGLKAALRANNEHFEGNRYTRWGKNNEAFARHFYEQETKQKVTETGFITNDKVPNAGYSPDGLVGEDGLIEVKCFQPKHHKELLAIKHVRDIPFEIMAQCQFGMLVSERKWCDLVAFNPRGDDMTSLFIFRIKRDKNIQQNMLDKLNSVKYI